MKDVWNYLKSAQKPIVLYGMGNGADLVLKYCKEYKIEVSGVFASDGFVRPKTFHGMPVTSYKTAKETFGDMIVLLCFGTSLLSVIENIKKIAGENELYAPDVPICGEELFTAEYYQSRKAQFDSVFSMLADEISKKTFKNIVDFKISGDINYLFDCETAEKEATKTFFKIEKNETYLDLGAYRGDTVLSFLETAGGYSKIIAVEPDEKSYKKLCCAVKDFENIQTVNAFAGERETTARITMNGSRGLSAAGTAREKAVVTVDSLNIAPTFIKMDIEGAEAAALRGARKTIRSCRPKMQIAAYHRAGDLIDIPKAVLNIRNDYKLYLRHNPCLPAWDVNFFFI